MNHKTLPVLLVLTMLYFSVKYFLPFGSYIIYPINLLVTYMHEFGHAFFALLTGGNVLEIEVKSDGSGLATTSGGWRSIILMGGYIGSALFGNILLRIWLQDKKDISEKILYLFAGLLILTAVFWFSSIISFVILLLLAGVLIVLAKYSSYDKVILQFIGVASILFIIEDFNVWPSSDLSKFSEIFVIIPQSVWMIIWLLVVLLMTGFNLLSIFSKR